MLTDRQIRAAKGAAKDQFISDGDGLYLRVQKTGTKTFLYRSKGKWLRLGTYPEISLLEARTEVNRLRGLTDVSLTVADVFKLYKEAVLRDFKRPEYVVGRFELDVIPLVGTQRIDSINKRDISRIIERILKRGSPIAANRTLADLKKLFKFAEERGYIEVNPILNVTRLSAGGREKPREVALTFAQIETYLAIDRGRMNLTTAAALYICLLTGLRAGEVLYILKTHATRIPADITKSGREHKVHLSRPVRAVLRIAHGLPLPGDTRVLAHALRRLSVPFTPHDLRRTMATRLSDMNVMPHVIEKMLDHKMEGVMGVYNRAEYWPEQVAAWELWGRKIGELRRKKKPRTEAGLTPCGD